MIAIIAICRQKILSSSHVARGCQKNTIFFGACSFADRLETFLTQNRANSESSKRCSLESSKENQPNSTPYAAQLVSKEVGDDIPLEAAEVWQTVFSVLHTVAAQRALLLRELTLHEVNAPVGVASEDVVLI